MTAKPLTIEGIAALLVQLTEDVRENTTVSKDMVEAMRIMTNSQESMAEAFRELLERITAEPEDEDNLRQLLSQISNNVMTILGSVNKAVGLLESLIQRAPRH